MRLAKSWKTLLIYHYHDAAIRECGGAALRGRMIDIGCGTKPYLGMLRPYVSEHVGLDVADPFNPRAQPDLVGTAYSIPSADESFDSALSTAALEHLEEPEIAIRECFRVLRSGGHAVYTVPFIWHTHAEPRDFYRFTSFGLEYLFKKCGFEVEEVKPLAGFWTTVVTLFNYYIAKFHRGIMRYVPVIPLLGVLLQGLAYILQSLHAAPEWTWMYRIIVRKPVR